jgi:hypothetical protein
MFRQKKSPLTFNKSEEINYFDFHVFSKIYSDLSIPKKTGNELTPSFNKLKWVVKVSQGVIPPPFLISDSVFTDI